MITFCKTPAPLISQLKHTAAAFNLRRSSDVQTEPGKPHGLDHFPRRVCFFDGLRYSTIESLSRACSNFAPPDLRESAGRAGGAVSLPRAARLIYAPAESISRRVNLSAFFSPLAEIMRAQRVDLHSHERWHRESA